jgi:uncharacterized membrane protein YdbT with pleckstrin-like domain
LASYVESIVGSGERVLYVGKVSLFSILPALVGATLLIAVGAAASIANPLASALAVVGIVWIGAALIKRRSTEVAVTDRRVIAKFGFIRRSTVELNIAKIESVRVEQSVAGRLFNYGSVFVTGTGATMDPIAFIADPIAFRQAVQSATDAVQEPAR